MRLVILGWSPKIFDIINELIIANESKRSPSIVIMAPKVHSDIQYMIKNKTNNAKNTRIIYRNGDPMLVCKNTKNCPLLFVFTDGICSVNPSRIDILVVGNEMILPWDRRIMLMTKIQNKM